MKIAICSTGKDLNSLVAEVFGRSPYFLIVAIKNNLIEGFETIKNTSINQTSGAGISVAQIVAGKNVNAVITGSVGPRALDILRQFNIKVYQGKGTVKEALEKFIERKLEKFEK